MAATHRVVLRYAAFQLPGLAVFTLAATLLVDWMDLPGKVTLAAVGLWRLRRWGVWLALVVAGAYFHGQVELLVMAFQQDLGWPMAVISTYFIAFSASFSVYLWRRKEHFS